MKQGSKTKTKKPLLDRPAQSKKHQGGVSLSLVFHGAAVCGLTHPPNARPQVAF
jgi:hypothetical protein